MRGSDESSTVWRTIFKIDFVDQAVRAGYLRFFGLKGRLPFIKGHFLKKKTASAQLCKPFL